MCYLRARCFEQIAYMEEARESYKAALRIDVKCYDAWKWMRTRHLLTPKEGKWTEEYHLLFIWIRVAFFLLGY